MTRNLKIEMAEMNKVPYLELLGIRVVKLVKGSARLVVAVDDRMQSKFGVLHGGVLSSLADAAVGIALFTMTQRGEKPVTVELNINYLRPIKGKQIAAEAHIVHKGHTIAVGDVNVTDDDGLLIAKSRATYMVVS
ncbi:PaaI family thioesterase [Chloroflexota bacterium]